MNDSLIERLKQSAELIGGNISDVIYEAIAELEKAPKQEEKKYRNLMVLDHDECPDHIFVLVYSYALRDVIDLLTQYKNYYKSLKTVRVNPLINLIENVSGKFEKDYNQYALPELVRRKWEKM